MNIMGTSLKPRITNMNSLRDAWVGLFDGAVSVHSKEEIKEALRANFNNEVEVDRKHGLHPFPFQLQRLPADIIVATIMVSGYHLGHLTYSYLSTSGKSDKHVFIGYSSGRHSQDKVFSDGSKMLGSVYIPANSLELLSANPGMPILLVDNVMESGITISEISKALIAHLGHSGTIYQCISSGIGGVTKAMYYYNSLAKPIITEGGEAFAEIKRGSR